MNTVETVSSDGFSNVQKETRWRFCSWAWLVLPTLLAIVCGLTATIHLASTRLNGLSWDDSEYIAQILTSYDMLAERGFARWPMHIAKEQGGSKPILYVNSVIASLALVGRNHLVQALALTAFATAAVFALVVFFLVKPVAGSGMALLAMIAVSGMPAVMQWSSMIYPDMQLAVLVLLIIGILAMSPGPWGPGLTIALGVLLGLVLLAKATAPSFLILPVLWWLLRGHPRDGGIIRRMGILIAAGIVALLVASVWYGTHWQEAVGYVKSSYGFKVEDQGPLMRRAWNWTNFLLWSGLGWPLVISAVLMVAAGFVKQKGEAAPRRESLWGVYIYFILGALPAIPIAISSSTPPNTRHLLATVVLLGTALAMFMGRRLSRVTLRPMWLAVVCLLMLGQFAAGRASQTSRWADRFSSINPNNLFASSLPLMLSRDVPSRIALDQTLSVAAAYAGTLPPDWYLAGNDSGVNQYSLEMGSVRWKLPLHFEFAVYFNWPEARCFDMLHRMATQPSVLVVYSGWRGNWDTDILFTKRDRELIQKFIDNPANGFKHLSPLTVQTEQYSLNFYSNNDRWARVGSRGAE